jgi:hypothetical protein
MTLIGLTVKNEKEELSKEADVIINPAFLCMYMRDNSKDYTSIVVSGCSPFPVAEHPDIISNLIRLSKVPNLGVPEKFTVLTFNNMSDYAEFLKNQ